METIEHRVDHLEDVLARFIKNTEIALADIRSSNARTDRKLLEMQHQADLDRKQADLDRKQADLDRKQADKERRDFNRRLAEVTDSQGLMIENMVWPNLTRIAGEIFGGNPVLSSAIRIIRQHPTAPGRHLEVDLLAASESAVLICEAKSKVDASKAREFLTHIASLAEFFPEYKNHRVIPMIASIAFSPSVLAFLTSKRIYALGFGDDTMEVLNGHDIRSASR